MAAIREQRQYPDQDAAHVLFSEHMKQLVVRMGDKTPFQYAHWEKMGGL